MTGQTRSLLLLDIRVAFGQRSRLEFLDDRHALLGVPALGGVGVERDEDVFDRAPERPPPSGLLRPPHIPGHIL